MTAVVIMALTFASCGNSGNKGGEQGQVQEQEQVQEQAQGIVGNWYYDDNTFYSFKEDGTGSYTYSGSLYGNFTYTENEGKLSLAYEGFDDPMVFNYKLEGKTLTILAGESNLGNDTEYTRK